jgi:hypothetical protein
MVFGYFLLGLAKESNPAGRAIKKLEKRQRRLFSFLLFIPLPHPAPSRKKKEGATLRPLPSFLINQISIYQA